MNKYWLRVSRIFMGFLNYSIKISWNRSLWIITAKIHFDFLKKNAILDYSLILNKMSFFLLKILHFRDKIWIIHYPKTSILLPWVLESLLEWEIAHSIRGTVFNTKVQSQLILRSNINPGATLNFQSTGSKLIKIFSKDFWIFLSH